MRTATPLSATSPSSCQTFDSDYRQAGKATKVHCEPMRPCHLLFRDLVRCTLHFVLNIWGNLAFRFVFLSSWTVGKKDRSLQSSAILLSSSSSTLHLHPPLPLQLLCGHGFQPQPPYQFLTSSLKEERSANGNTNRNPEP